MKLLRWATLILLITSGSFTALAEINYSKNIELPPLRISYAELQDVLDKAASLINDADGSIPLYREEMDLRKKEVRVQMTGHRMEEPNARLPATLDRFEYSLWTKDDAAPVTRLSLSFSDYSRTLSIEGRSPNQVDAIFAALRDELLSISTPLGGSINVGTFRLVVAFLLVMGMMLLGQWWEQRRRRIVLGPLVLAIALLVAVFWLPLGDLFAGFAAVRGDASLMVRYGAQISFLSLVVGVVAFAGWLIQLFFSTTR